MRLDDKSPVGRWVLKPFWCSSFLEHLFYCLVSGEYASFFSKVNHHIKGMFFFVQLFLETRPRKILQWHLRVQRTFFSLTYSYLYILGAASFQQLWEGKVEFSILGRLKNVSCHPGGDWNPGRGVGLPNLHNLHPWNLRRMPQNYMPTFFGGYQYYYYIEFLDLYIIFCCSKSPSVHFKEKPQQSSK